MDNVRNASDAYTTSTDGTTLVAAASGSGSGLSGLEIFVLVVGILGLLALIGFFTKTCLLKLWRQYRGYPAPSEPPPAVFTPRDHVRVDVPSFNRERRLTTASVNSSEFGPAGRVPLDDEANTFAHDWFDFGTCSNIKRADIEYIKELGRGWFGKVVEARVKRMNPFHETTSVVVKQLSEEASTRDQVRFLHEARMYRDSEDHENVLKLAKYSIEKAPFLLLYEAWPLGDLKAYLPNIGQERLCRDNTLLIRMAIDIAKALTWMESAGFVHADLAARNCLVANTAGKIVVGDYGLSPTRYSNDYYWSSDLAVPVRWAAPETITCPSSDTIVTTKVNPASNVWTFGVVLWEIIELGQRPYLSLSDAQVLDQVITGNTFVLEQPVNPCFSDKFLSIFYRKFMLPCLSYAPENRPKIEQVLTALSTPSLIIRTTESVSEI